MSKVAAVQMTSSDNVDENLEIIASFAKVAKQSGAKLLVLPENAVYMGKNEAEKFEIAEQDGQGPIQDFMAALAKEHQLWLVGGTMPIKPPNPVEKDKNRVFSASLVWDDKGNRVARYDKIHLFDVIVEREKETYLESSTVIPGKKTTSLDTPFGKLGLSVCYDLRFPELYRKLFGEGVQIFTVPSAFTAVTGKAHWETLLRSRAIENFSYVIAPNQGGIHRNGRRTWGHSMIIDPWGKVLAEAENTDVIFADIDLSYLQDIRDRFPVSKHRRIF